MILAIYAVCACRLRGWNLGSFPRFVKKQELFPFRRCGCRAPSTVTVAFTASLLLFFVFELGVLYSVQERLGFSFLSSSWVFLGLNMLMMTVVVQRSHFPSHLYSLKVLLARMERYVRLQRDEEQMDHVLSAEVGDSSGDEQPEDEPMKPRAIVKAALQAALRPPAARKWFCLSRHAVTFILYLIATSFLVIHAVLNYSFSDNAIDSGKMLGIVTLVNVLIIDLTMFLMKVRTSKLLN